MMLKNSQNYINKCTVRIDVPIKSTEVDEFPLAWEKTFYKEYQRFKSRELVAAEGNSELQRLIKARKTEREYSSDLLSFDDLSKLLYWSVGEVSERKNIKHRAYPSAGGRYPVECYVAVLNVDDLDHGLYHYNIRANSLEMVKGQPLKEIFKSAFFGKFASAPVFIILTGIFSRSEVKYGTKAMTYIFMEAGEISQNIALNCGDLGLASCTVCGFETETVAELLDLEIYDEVPLCCFAVGNKLIGRKEVKRK